MSITPRLGAGYTAGVDYTTYTSASSPSATLSKPSGVADNVTLRALVYSSVSAGAVMTPPTGWTLEANANTRRGGVYRKVIPSAAAETATSYQWTAASAGRVLAAVWIETGDDATTPVDVVGVWSTEATTATAAAITASGADLLLEFVYWNNSSATTTTVNVPGTSTKLLDLASPTTGNTSGIAIGLEQLSGSGSTGTRAFTGSPTPTNMSALLIGFKAAAATTQTGDTTLTVTAAPTATATVTRYGDTTQTVIVTPSAAGTVGGASDTSLTVTATPTAAGTRTVFADTALAVQATPTADSSTVVSRFLAATPTFTAHRGGSADWPEMTLYAYTQAAAWNPNLALEVSCIRTSDGLWMASHDSTTDRVFGVHYDITSTPWSTLQTLRTTVGNQPPALLTDILAAFPGRVMVVDNKMSSFLSSWLDILDANGGPGRIIVKGYGPQAADITKADAATARGYKTWGYYYHADTPNLASTQSHWSILGEDAVGSPPGDATDWAAIKSYGKPVWAHIIATKTQKTYADGFTPTGYMVSGVMEVVPQFATADTSLAATVAPTAAGTVTRVGDAGTTIQVAPTAAGARVVVADAPLFVAAAPSASGMLRRFADSALQITVTTTAGVRQPVFADTLLHVAFTSTATADPGGSDITVFVDGPYRNALAVSGPTRNPLTVSGATT